LELAATDMSDIRGLKKIISRKEELKVSTLQIIYQGNRLLREVKLLEMINPFKVTNLKEVKPSK
jgi:hypothetical protein